MSLHRRAGAIRHWQDERSQTLATGTLACPRCDVPVAPGPGTLSPAATLGCPFCGHDGAVRDFLSLESPSRPAHVLVRVVLGAQPPRARNSRRTNGTVSGGDASSVPLWSSS